MSEWVYVGGGQRVRKEDARTYRAGESVRAKDERVYMGGGSRVKKGDVREYRAGESFRKSYEKDDVARCRCGYVICERCRL